jgi:CheY-like chemotaxis protein
MIFRSKKTILIVDDDEAFAYATSRYLQELGYNTIIVGSSSAALREFESGRAIDLMIADVKLLPGEPHGISLARVVQNHRRDLPVILLTAYPEVFELEKPLPGPAFGKPIDLARLAGEVKISLSGER